MKSLIIMACLIFTIARAEAQILKKLKDKVVTKTEQKTEAKVDHKIDVAIDSVLEGNVHLPKNETRSQNDSFKQEKEMSSPGGSVKAEVKTTYLSKFDFIPGEQIVLVEDFSEVAVGDFPAKWNTNGSGEVVSINGLDGKWLMMNSQSNYALNELIALPENCTVQFELMISLPYEWRNEPVYFALAVVKNPANYLNTSHYSLNSNDNKAFWLGIHPSNSDSNGYGSYLLYNTSTSNLVNEKLDLKNYFTDKRDKLPLKVSIWRQNQRIRVYLNENKILDLPKILPSEMTVNSLVWQTLSLQGDNKYFLGNIRIAAGNPDTRNKLLTEGKLVSNGILFAVNSDIIKPESYGIIKEIASIFKENKELNIKIIGHTDGDGDDASNLNLSNKRAVAVKNMLINEFKIDTSRLETDGKGESEPLAPNTSALNKATNRRVEFVKTK